MSDAYEYIAAHIHTHCDMCTHTHTHTHTDMHIRGYVLGQIINLSASYWNAILPALSLA